MSGNALRIVLGICRGAVPRNAYPKLPHSSRGEQQEPNPSTTTLRNPRPPNFWVLGCYAFESSGAADKHGYIFTPPKGLMSLAHSALSFTHANRACGLQLSVTMQS
eukprot:4234623-Amphidinium_carterae.1